MLIQEELLYIQNKIKSYAKVRVQIEKETDGNGVIFDLSERSYVIKKLHNLRDKIWDDIEKDLMRLIIE